MVRCFFLPREKNEPEKMFISSPRMSENHNQNLLERVSTLRENLSIFFVISVTLAAINRFLDAQSLIYYKIKTLILKY